MHDVPVKSSGSGPVTTRRRGSSMPQCPQVKWRGEARLQHAAPLPCLLSLALKSPSSCPQLLYSFAPPSLPPACLEESQAKELRGNQTSPFILITQKCDSAHLTCLLGNYMRQWWRWGKAGLDCRVRPQWIGDERGGGGEKKKP